jgi:parvulin-like peptidyl-prolyl isomerase
MLTATKNRISLENLIDEVKMSGRVNELIQSVLRRQVIAQQAEENGIRTTDEELQIATDNFRTLNSLETVEDTWKWLQSHFLSLDDLGAIVKDQLITGKLAHHLFAEKVERFFYQNLLEYSGATIYEVVLEDKELGMELFYLIEEGDLSFADVARQYIADPELKRRGGYLGTINRKQLRPEISAAVFMAKPPELITPVVTAMGIHLIYVEEIIQPELDSQLHQQIMMNMFDRWLEQQIAIVAAQTLIDIN